MKVIQIDAKGRVVGEWESATEAASKLGLDASHISKCLRGKRNRHGGYKWRYEDGDIDTNVLEEEKSFLESRTSDYKEDSAVLTAKTQKSITSLEEAIEFFEIDTEKWEVDRFIVNSWDVTMKVDDAPVKRTNYQVKLFLNKKEKGLDEIYEDISKVLVDYTPKILNYNKGEGIITVELADLHIGAEVKNLVRTKNFDITIISDYLRTISEIVNSYGANKVYLNLHGDFMESISGLNHEDSWKSMAKGLYGANSIIVANEIIAGNLISNINNIEEINIVSGNHDRISASRNVDGYGEGAKLLAYMLQKDFPDVKINFDYLILVREIDGINHIITHGHHGISKKDLSKVVADFGKTGMFNLWTEGHLHNRLSKKVLKTKIATYDSIDYVELDQQNYRKLVLPPIFTGNFFSESLGFANNAGFVVTYNNGKGFPNVNDYSL